MQLGLETPFGEVVVNCLVGAFVFCTASIPHCIHEDVITVLVVYNEEVIHASIIDNNELTSLVRVHSSCDRGTARISVFNALVGHIQEGVGQRLWS